MIYQNVPGIAIVLAIVGGLAILGGAYLCIETWPAADAGYLLRAGEVSGEQYTRGIVQYIPSLTWASYAIVAGAIFFAAAAALTYLQHTRDYTKLILQRVSEHERVYRESDE